MEKVITVDISKSKFLRANPQWQYNHGQKLQFVGVELPPYYEVHFSNSINGEAKKQLGDSSGVLIPFEYFQPGKSIYAWIYIIDSDSGITQRQVEIPIHKKAICTDEEPTPEQSDIIEEAIGALNSALDEVDDRIEAALDSAKQSGEFDGTDGTTIWTTSQAPSYPNYTFIIANLTGTPGAIPKEKDLIFYDLKYYKIVNVGETSVLSSLYVDVRDNNVLHKTGDEMLGALSMGANKITNLANGTNNYDAVNLRQVKQMIADEGSTYRGSFNTKAALLAAPWQNVDRELPYYVDNKDFAIVQADESNNNECWRYMYTTGTGWGEQYKINDAPLSQAQIDALNSGITAIKVQKLDTIEPSAEVNIIEEIRAKNPVTEQWIPLPVINKGVNLPDFQIPEEIYYTDFIVTKNGDDFIVTGSDLPPYIITQIKNGQIVIGRINYDGIFYALVTEAVEQPLNVYFTCQVNDGIFLNIQNEEEYGWTISFFTAANEEIVETAVSSLSEAINTKYSKPSNGIPASDLADDVPIVPSGGTTGQILKKISNNDWDVDWADDSGADNNNAWTVDAQNTRILGNYVQIPVAYLVGPSGASAKAGDIVFISDGRFTQISRIVGQRADTTLVGDLHGAPGDPGDDGYSPEVTITEITGGHRITITDEDHPDGQSFDVMDGAGGGISPYTSNPAPLGTASPGSSDDYARGDHVHENNLFVCVYGTTTNSEINTALNAGKAVVVPHAGYIYYLSTIVSSTRHIFGAAGDGTTHCVVCDNGSWSVQAYTIPTGSDTTPQALGTAAAGSSPDYSRADHVHAKPTYSKSDVGLGNVDNVQQYSASNPPPYPVSSVNGQTGAVTLSIPSTASDVGAVAVEQGVAHAGEFVVVGLDGNITTVTMTAWSGGSY